MYIYLQKRRNQGLKGRTDLPEFKQRGLAPPSQILNFGALPVTICMALNCHQVKETRQISYVIWTFIKEFY